MMDHRPRRVLRRLGIHLVPCLEQKGYGPVTYGCPTKVGNLVMFRMAREIPRGP
jgi:hypothetical protein